jgi:CDP-4-dehydro-6-deoxyglucose reductase, E1
MSAKKPPVRAATPEMEALRERVFAAVRDYHAAAFAPRPFEPGKTPIPPSGKIFDAEEMVSLVDSGLDFWLTAGRFAERFERDFAKRVGLPYSLLVNSGSSANLLALSTLTAPELGERRLRPGDEVISTASSFPTTINPILQNGAVPVLVDVDIPTYNATADKIAAAVGPKTRAIMLAHTLGNPFELDAVKRIAEERGLWLVEDCCDALGASFRGQGVGTFGDLATFSFYPAHHITMGEGGAVAAASLRMKKLLESFRDWGRDCWCQPGCDNTCGKRFDWQLGELPCGYDHKYTYSHIGYNLKLTDMQAAVGVAQLQKLDGFLAARRQNFARLREGLRELEEFFILPEATEGADPAWFGFPIAVRPDAPFSRNQVTSFLEQRKIATRLLFGGNLTRQPAYQGQNFRTIGNLRNTDFVMDRVFWIGLYPGLTAAMLDYTVETFRSLCATPLLCPTR